MRKSTLATAMALALGVTGAAQAIQVTPPGFGPIMSIHGNFTMLQPNGGMQGGTNDVNFTWDGTVFTDSSDYLGPGGGSIENMFASSDEPFSSNIWTAHDIQIFAPGGTYVFDTVDNDPTDASSPSMYRVSPAANQFLVHMLFDWGANADIDVVLLVEQGGIFGSGDGHFETFFLSGRGLPIFPCLDPGANCLWDGQDDGTYYTAGTTKDGHLPDSDGDGLPDGGVIWDLVTVDGPYETSNDGGTTWVAHAADGIPGIPMLDGGFVGFNAGFNGLIVPVPVPAAVWLFGSGLLGLVGVARRKKSA